MITVNLSPDIKLIKQVMWLVSNIKIENMKKIIVMCLLLYISLCANAQATDLVVDCQTPGWLSSKINYGDQQTVKNLKGSSRTLPA